MRFFYILMLAFAFAIAPAWGQTGEAHPKKAFWAAVTLLGASTIADAETTQAYQRVGYWETESPWLYGKYPTRPRFYLVSGAIEIPAVILSYHLLRSHSKLVRWGGWGVLGWQLADRTLSTARNAALIQQGQRK